MRAPTVTLFSLASLAFLLASPALAAPAPTLAAGPATEPPTVDIASVILYPDQGRLELRGTHLLGARVRWVAAAGPGESTCLDPTAAGKAEQCAFSVPKDLGADASLTLLPPAPPPGAAPPGAPPPAPGTPLRPARVVLDRLLPAASVVDLTSGIGRLPLAHPEAVGAVDCMSARCELTEAAILVRAVPGPAATMTLRLKLAPRYFLSRGDAQDAVVVRSVSVLHCPAAVVSGDPLRNADSTRIVVRMDERCGHDARDLTWTVNGKGADVQRVEKGQGGVYVQLGVSEIEEEQVTVMASRPEPDESVIAVARAQTRPAPQPRAVLELPGFGRIGFLPTNRDAVLLTGPVGEHARLYPLPVEGAYRVISEGSPSRVRGEEGAAGFVALRFGYRVDTLPPAFATTDLAVVTEPLQRPIREASVPVSFSSSAMGPKPLLELVCADGQDVPRRILPGTRVSIPYAQRDSCRLVIHREWLTPEDGTQDITVDVSITKVDDTPRADAHVSERMVLRPGTQPRLFWIHGVRGQFDRVTVRVSHVVDEAHDVGGSELSINLPAAQWSVVVGNGRLRFYATATIPTGLFRITAPSDVLTLNFGALSRLTWLDHEGHEGLLGLEAGALGIGLAATPDFPRTLAVLLGIGVSVPIGNRGETSQAAVNLHAWMAYELRSEVHTNPTDPLSPLASHFSFLFGPSITIGNIGTNL
jgi:hypothetical protein